jgi:hypothetical protein
MFFGIHLFSDYKFHPRKLLLAVYFFLIRAFFFTENPLRLSSVAISVHQQKSCYYDSIVPLLVTGSAE